MASNHAVLLISYVKKSLRSKLHKGEKLTEIKYSHSEGKGSEKDNLSLPQLYY